jgi:alkylation response protein AidB-like acyl-CoA dehydrogenase
MIDEVRAEARAWLREHWDPAQTVRAWWAAVAEAGWQFPSWPDGLGGLGLDASAERAVWEEMAALGVLGPPFNLGTLTGAPTILAFGRPDQRDRLLTPLALGLEAWCQLFSEPDAGSDLASVRTRADRDGPQWRVHGAKVWSSGAAQADRGMLLARTDHDAAKHRGLSFFVLPLRQDGVEIRPLRQMNGVSGHFNEVFLDGPVVVDADLVHGPGDGWPVALNVLALERFALQARVPGLVYGSPGRGWGQLDRAAGDVVAEGPQASDYVANRAWVDAARLVDLARRRVQTGERLARQHLADVVTLERVIDQTVQRPDVPGGPNLTKLAKTVISRRCAALGLDLLGADGMLAAADAPEDGGPLHLALTAPSFSIAGGTDEIQRNVVAERALGLPR